MINVSEICRNGDRRPMLFSKAIEGFILHAKSGVYSPAHIPTMHGYLKYICKFLGDPEIESVRADDLNRYMHHLHTEYQPKRFNGDKSPLSLSSIDNHWKTIRGFFNWAVEVLELQNRPDLKLQRPKYETAQVLPFSKEEIIRLIDACQFTQVTKQTGRTYKIKRPNSERDKAIIMILLDTGMRLGELTRLRLGDVDLETGEVHVQPFRSGRKSKGRTVYIGARTKQILWRYTAKMELPIMTFSKDLLFVLKGSSIRNLLKRIGNNAKVFNTHPHRFRHTMAIMYLRNGGDVFTLQILLGHSTLDMVKRYLDIVREDVLNAHRHASPVDNWRL